MRRQFILPIVFVALLLVLLDKDLIYIPLAIVAVIITIDVVNMFMYSFPYEPRVILVNNYPEQYHGQQIANKKMGAESQYNDEYVNIRTMRENYLQNLQNQPRSDNTWISTSSVVNPDDRLHQEFNVRDSREFKPINLGYRNPVQSHPNINVEEMSNLNINRNVGGFRLGNTSSFGNKLKQQNDEMGEWFSQNTGMQRNYMQDAAESKVAHKLDMRRQYPIHQMSSLLGYH